MAVPAVRFGFLFALFLLLPFGMAWGQAGAPVRLGIMPYNSPLAILRVHQPLREHLQAKLGMPVEIQTDRDFPSYVADVLAGRFDVVILAPHMAVLAFQDARYRPLFRYRAMLEPLLLVRKDSDIERLDQMRGRKVAVASPLAVITIVGLQRLRQEGVAYPSALVLDERFSHGAAIAAVAVGDADAALTNENSLRQVPEDVRARLRGIRLGVALPHLVTMANPALGEAQIERISAALASFPDTEGGHRFFAETGYGGYEPFSRDDAKRLLPYAEIVRQMLDPERLP